MSVSRGRRSISARSAGGGSGSRGAASDKPTSGKITNNQRKFLRRLLLVLAEIVDEKDHFVEAGDEEDPIDEYGSVAESGEYQSDRLQVGHVSLSSYVNADTEETDVRKQSTRVPKIRYRKGSDSDRKDNDTPVFKRLHKICVDFGQITFQIRGSLNALGGGGHTAKALELMHTGITGIKNSIDLFNESSALLVPQSLVYSLKQCREAISEASRGFKELGIFNTSFFDTVDRLSWQLEECTASLEAEYEHGSLCGANSYLAYLFEPLTVKFEDFLLELTNIAEKEIAAIRQTQEFTSQRYLNLTTIATFLSSVTATTLQITADIGASTLATTTNTLWFISLVFSTASAVYSLLIMTWCQSSVRQPDLSLSSYAHAWLRNGPMYALIGAVMAFSTGLCLLAFLILNERGGLSSAVVPTAFAGLHAYVILLFSAWFLLEQWKAKHDPALPIVTKKYLWPGKKFNVGYLYRLKRGLNNVAQSMFATAYCMRSYSVQGSTDIDVESGRDELGNSAMPHKPEVLEDPEQRHQGTGSGEGQEKEGAQMENTIAPPVESSFLSSEHRGAMLQTDSSHVSLERGPPSQKLVLFDPDGVILASAYEDKVVIYDVYRSFNLLTALKVEDVDTIRQIAWNRDEDEECLDCDYKHSYLLVRSSRAVLVYHCRPPYMHFEGRVQESFVSARWVDVEDAGLAGFACANNTAVKIFSRKCEELTSYDFSGASSMERILDFVCEYAKLVICLATAKVGQSEETHLLVFNGDCSVLYDEPVNFGHTSMTFSSQGFPKFYLQGSRRGGQLGVLGLSDRNSIDVHLFPFKNVLDRYHGSRFTSLTYNSSNENIVITFRMGEISVYRPWSENDNLHHRVLHRFSTSDTRASIQNTVSFDAAPLKGHHPHLFAFRDEDGSTKIWSVQSNVSLLNSVGAEHFEVHDECVDSDRRISKGQFLILPPPILPPTESE